MPGPDLAYVGAQERAKQFPTKAARQIKTFANIYRIRSAIGSDSNFSAKSFVEEAAGIYRYGLPRVYPGRPDYC